MGEYAGEPVATLILGPTHERDIPRQVSMQGFFPSEVPHSRIYRAQANELRVQSSTL